MREEISAQAGLVSEGGTGGSDWLQVGIQCWRVLLFVAS